MKSLEILAAIKCGEDTKYSPNLYRHFKKETRNGLLPALNVYDDGEGVMWIGRMDDDGWFNGCRLIQSLCLGTKSDTFAYPPSRMRLRELAGFWPDYIRDGRCAIDRKHAIDFLNSESRWHEKRNVRFCQWCNAVSQKRVKYVEKIRREKWVTI